MFSTMEFGAASPHVRATSTGNASPQNRLSRRPGYWPGFSSPKRFMKTAVEGTENQIESRESLMNLPGLIIAFCEGQHTHAPRSHAAYMSWADKSKVISKVCETRSSAVIV